MRRAYWDDPYASEFDATITDIYQLSSETLGVELSKTYFYPESGGQPFDTGQLQGHKVLAVKYADSTHSRIVHEVKAPQTVSDNEGNLAKGSLVTCSLDWPRRLRNMRAHTAGHLIYGAARRLFSRLDYAGFNIADDGTASIYLRTEEPLGPEKVADLEKLVNVAVLERASISTFFCKAAEVTSIKDIVYTVDPSMIPGDEVRIVEISGWDIAVCGGTHFFNTIDVGVVALTSRETHKKNVTRINYAVDGPALQTIGQRARSVSALTELLGASAADLAKRVGALVQSAKDHAADTQKLEQHLANYVAEELIRNARPRGNLLISSLLTRDLSQESIAGALHRRMRSTAQSICCVAGTKDSRFIVVAASPGLGFDITHEMREIMNSLPFKGGGNSELFQAQGVGPGLQDLIQKACDSFATRSVSI